MLQCKENHKKSIYIITPKNKKSTSSEMTLVNGVKLIHCYEFILFLIELVKNFVPVQGVVQVFFFGFCTGIRFWICYIYNK